MADEALIQEQRAKAWWAAVGKIKEGMTGSPKGFGVNGQDYVMVISPESYTQLLEGTLKDAKGKPVPYLDGNDTEKTLKKDLLKKFGDMFKADKDDTNLDGGINKNQGGVYLVVHRNGKPVGIQVGQLQRDNDKFQFAVEASQYIDLKAETAKKSTLPEVVSVPLATDAKEMGTPKAKVFDETSAFTPDITRKIFDVSARVITDPAVAAKLDKMVADSNLNETRKKLKLSAQQIQTTATDNGVMSLMSPQALQDSEHYKKLPKNAQQIIDDEARAGPDRRVVLVMDKEKKSVRLLLGTQDDLQPFSGNPVPTPTVSFDRTVNLTDGTGLQSWKNAPKLKLDITADTLSVVGTGKKINVIDYRKTDFGINRKSAEELDKEFAPRPEIIRDTSDKGAEALPKPAEKDPDAMVTIHNLDTAREKLKLSAQQTQTTETDNGVMSLMSPKALQDSSQYQNFPKNVRLIIDEEIRARPDARILLVMDKEKKPQRLLLGVQDELQLVSGNMAPLPTVSFDRTVNLTDGTGLQSWKAGPKLQLDIATDFGINKKSANALEKTAVEAVKKREIVRNAPSPLDAITDVLVQLGFSHHEHDGSAPKTAIAKGPSTPGAKLG